MQALDAERPETWIKPPDEEKAVAERETVRRASTPREVVEIYSDDVWRFVSSQLSRREDAEDTVMEVFSAAFAGFHKLSRVDDQRLWLLAIARRKVAGHLRQRYRRAEQPLTETHTLPDQPETEEMHEEVRIAMNTLPAPQAEALVLKYVSGLSTEEVSRVIRKSLPATNSLLQRARGALRDAMGPRFAQEARRLS